MGIYADKAAALADGLIHHWIFEDYEGNQFTDQAGDWHGEAINPSGHSVNSAIVPTPLGKGLDTSAFGIAARDDMIFAKFPVAGRNAAFSLTDYTIRVRFYTQAEAVLGQGWASELLSIGITPQDSYDWTGNNHFVLNTYNVFEAVGTDSKVEPIIGDHDLTISSVPIRNAWVDFVISVHDGVANYFVLGSKHGVVPSTTSPFKPYTTDGLFGSLGATRLMKSDLNGILDELSIWDRGLSDAEVVALYDSGDPIKLIGADAEIVLPEIIADIDRSLIQSIRYTAELVQGGLGLPALMLPISSFNGRSRSGRDSYLSIVIPNGAIYQEEIALRPQGSLIIRRVVDGVSSEFMRVWYDDSRIDNGGASGNSLTLSGSQQTTNSSPKSVTLENCSYYSNTSFRFPISNDIEPGDTLSFNGVDTVVDTISYIVSATYQIMELSS